MTNKRQSLGVRRASWPQPEQHLQDLRIPIASLQKNVINSLTERTSQIPLPPAESVHSQGLYVDSWQEVNDSSSPKDPHESMTDPDNDAKDNTIIDCADCLRPTIEETVSEDFTLEEYENAIELFKFHQVQRPPSDTTDSMMDPRPSTSVAAEKTLPDPSPQEAENASLQLTHMYDQTSEHPNITDERNSSAELVKEATQDHQESVTDQTDTIAVHKNQLLTNTDISKQSREPQSCIRS